MSAYTIKDYPLNFKIIMNIKNMVYSNNALKHLKWIMSFISMTFEKPVTKHNWSISSQFSHLLPSEKTENEGTQRLPDAFIGYKTGILASNVLTMRTILGRIIHLNKRSFERKLLWVSSSCVILQKMHYRRKNWSLHSHWHSTYLTTYIKKLPLKLPMTVPKN